MRLPAGYELTSISGSSLETSEPREGGVIAHASAIPRRAATSFSSASSARTRAGRSRSTPGFVSAADVQRERGEVAIEGVGTLELDRGPTRRHAPHRRPRAERRAAVARAAADSLGLPLSADRRRAAGLALDVKRFADAGVLAAVADRAVATTLVTTEGRALTEIMLELQNRAQPFLKVTLPPGASMVSVEVAGESAKPALGADGTRVPLLRRASGRTAPTRCRSSTCTPARRSRARANADGAAEDGHAGRPRRMGGVRARALLRARGRRQRDRPEAAFRRRCDLPRGISRDRPSGAWSGGRESDGRGAGVGQEPARVEERIEVNAESLKVDRQPVAPSQNVINLQRRTSGVLPIRVDVPRAGTSHRFVKPLVVDQETTVTLRYKRR